MKADGGQLELVARLRREDERCAGEELRAARARLSEEEQRLLAVERYAEEYRNRGLTELRDPRLLREQRAFVTQLQHTCQAQHHQVLLARQVLEAARLRWITTRTQRQAIERLSERRQKEHAACETRAEQRQQDELAVRAASRRVSLSDLS